VRTLGWLKAKHELAQAERARELIAAAPAERVERDGKVFVLRRLAEQQDARHAPAPAVVPRAHRAAQRIA
jgi:hypothetical protein